MYVHPICLGPSRDLISHIQLFQSGERKGFEKHEYNICPITKSDKSKFLSILFLIYSQNISYVYCLVQW